MVTIRLQRVRAKGTPQQTLEHAYLSALEALTAIGVWAVRFRPHDGVTTDAAFALFDDLYSNLERISALYKTAYKTLPVHMRFPFSDRRGETTPEQPTRDFPATSPHSEREDTSK